MNLDNLITETRALSSSSAVRGRLVLLLRVEDLFFSFGLSIFISSQLHVPACLLPLHITFLVLLVYSVYSVY
jgi:hypothetical protein